MDHQSDSASDGNGRGLSRRDLIVRGAVASGAAALVWSAPTIEGMGLTPAGASTTIIIDTLTFGIKDKNSNSGSGDYCPGSPKPCCGQSWGNSGSGADQWVLSNPFTGCTNVTITLVATKSPCDLTLVDPDVNYSALTIAQTGNCGCTIVHGIVRNSNDTIITTINRGSSICASSTDISWSPNLCADLPSDARLGVLISCTPT